MNRNPYRCVTKQAPAFAEKTMTAVTVVTAMTVKIYMGEKKNGLSLPIFSSQ